VILVTEKGQTDILSEQASEGLDLLLKNPKIYTEQYEFYI
jgi:hypothetical protein